MSVLTPAQIEQYAYNAGFRGNDLILAVAVAEAESAGNTQAYNPETAAGTVSGSGSRGLWQIYGTAHPEYNNSAVYDPQANARAAYSVYHNAGNSFRPWSTYLNGAAQQIARSLNLPTINSVSSPISAVGGVTVAPIMVGVSTPSLTNPNIMAGVSTPAIPGSSQSNSLIPDMSSISAGIQNGLTSGITGSVKSLIPTDLGDNFLLGGVGVILLIFGFVLLVRSL